MKWTDFEPVARSIERKHGPSVCPGREVIPKVTKDQARAAVFEYIEMFYNRTRLHASLNSLNPEAFEAGRVR